jgi:hypothetical protein
MSRSSSKQRALSYDSNEKDRNSQMSSNLDRDPKLTDKTKE